MKYSGERGKGGQRVFVGVMKYCRHILMEHEIFFIIFDGQKNIFLCFIFVVLFFKLKHKIFKVAIKEIYKREDMINKSHLLSRYKTNSGKNNKKQCLMHFDPDNRVFVLSSQNTSFSSISSF